MKKLNNLASLIGYHKEYEGLINIYKEEVSTIKELKQKLDLIFSKREFDEFKEEINILKKEILENELESDYNEFKKRVIKNTNLKGKKLFMPLRMLMVNLKEGPEIKDLYSVMRPYLKMIIKEYR